MSTGVNVSNVLMSEVILSTCMFMVLLIRIRLQANKNLNWVTLKNLVPRDAPRTHKAFRK